MRIVSEKITLPELKQMAASLFEDMVKGVVDIDRSLLALDAELHSDLEAELLQKGSAPKNLWGVNLYPDLFDSDDFIEFDSLINLKPSQGNRSRGVDDPAIQKRIREIIHERTVAS